MKKENDEELEEIQEEGKEKKVKLVIEEFDFKMEASSAGNNKFFDLYFMHTVNKDKGDKERNEFKLEGYGYTLASCLTKIAAHRSHYTKRDHYNSFKEYVDDYKMLVDELKNLFGQIPNHTI